MDSALRDAIIKAVDDSFDEQIAYTQKLVAFRSQRGEEFPIQDFFAEDFAKRGLKLDRFDMDEAQLTAHPGGAPFSAEHSRAPIVVGIHHPREVKGRSLILQHHIDVVPVGPEDMWENPPYAGVIKNGRMYGRGAGDMKAGAGSNVYALAALKAAGVQPAAPVYLQSVVEEESTGNGALMTTLRGYTADAALIPEPTGGAVCRANVGVLWFTVDVRGIPVHVSQMGEGANAIDAAYRVVGSLREIETKWNAESANHRGFEHLDHPINMNIGIIEGGDWGSSVPAWCRFQVRISLYPGWNAAEKLAEIRNHVAAFSRGDNFLAQNPPVLTSNGFHAEGFYLEPGSEAEATLAKAHEVAYGAPMGSLTMPAYLDGRVYALYNKIPTLVYGAASQNNHGFDESVDIESIRQNTKAIALFIAEWCGTEPL